MSKEKDKYLLVVSFLEGKNFIKRPRTKFIIEAKFDGEHLATDPVEHDEIIEINQELAWELNKKTLKMHKLQRSAIKAICYAVSETSKENIGYIILDIRSAPEGTGKPEWHQLLQSKYVKSKPAIQVNIYIEDDHQANGDELAERSSSITNNINNNNSLNNLLFDSLVPFKLNESEGYFQIGKPSSNARTYVLTVNIMLAKNLVRLLSADVSSPRSFFFTYSFMDNQVTTKPFEDIISCQINGERSSIRLNGALDVLKRFLLQQNELVISFCSENHVLAKAILCWKNFVTQLNEESEINSNLDTPVLIEYKLKFESTDQTISRASPTVDISMTPIIVLEVGLAREQLNESMMSAIDNTRGLNCTPSRIYEDTIEHVEPPTKLNKPTPPSIQQQAIDVRKSQDNIYQNDDHRQSITKNHNQNYANNYQQQQQQSQQQQQLHQQQPRVLPVDPLSLITEDMQLKVAYELQVWREAREKEFEQQLKKIEAKKLQALADAFKKHDIEREMIVQKRIKEYNDLELVLKNSLNEVEKREKQLALNEAQIARLKADMHHELENKLIEYREASKRVQEKADHQVALQKVKIDNLEEEIMRLKRHIIDWEKKYADKEAEFSRYKEKENSRPELRLQTELNVLNLDKMELERKLDAAFKAKNHYKEQWTRALQEIALIKKREEINAKTMLKKQQAELEQLKLKVLANEDSESIKSDERQLQSIRNEIEKLKLNSYRSQSDNDLRSINNYNSNSNTQINSTNDIDPTLRAQIQRMTEERDTLLRTGAYSNTDAIIIELDRRIKDFLKEARL